jgi:hypothetical protein
MWIGGPFAQSESTLLLHWVTWPSLQLWVLYEAPSVQRFFFGREIAKKRDNLQMCKCDPLYYTASKLQDRSNAPKFSDDITSLWMNVPTLDE